MFDYFMINYVTNATFFLMFFLTILSYLFALKSKEKSHQVLGMFLFYIMYTISSITIIVCFFINKLWNTLISFISPLR